MDYFYAVVCVALIPVALVSFRNRNDPSALLGPMVREKCGVELRGWHSSGRKQVWTKTNYDGTKRYFCAKCKNK